MLKRHRRKLHIRCVVMHIESEEILAVQGDVFDETSLWAQHILTVARRYPDLYIVVEGFHNTCVADKSTTYDVVCGILEAIAVLELIEGTEV